MPRRLCLGMLLALALLATLYVARLAAQEIHIDTPQPAAILFASGKNYRGELRLLSDKEVRFKISGFTTVSSYPSAKVRAMQTKDDVYIYDVEKGIFQSAKNPLPGAAEPAPVKKPAPAEQPAAGAAKAENVKSQPVLASGVGLNPKEALKVAFRNAVQQVVVETVEAEVRTRTEAVISEKVLSDSDAFITAYKKISENVEEGIHQVKITAEVERRAVAAKLKAAGVAIKGNAGQGLFKGVLNDLESQKTAAESIRKGLGDFPGNVLKVDVVGKPRLVSKTDTEATFEYDLKFEVDAEKYNAFVKRMVPLLEKVAAHKSSGVTQSMEGRSQDILAAEGMLEPRRFFPNNQGLQKFQWTGAKFLNVRSAPVAADTNWGGKGFDPVTSMVLAVSTSHSPMHDKVNWRLYRVPRSRDYHLGLQIYVRFLDKDKKELIRDTFPLMPHHGLVITEKLAPPAVQGNKDGKAYPFAVISPYFVTFHGQDWLYASGLILPQRATVTLEELRQLDSIQCAFTHVDLLRPENRASR